MTWPAMLPHMSGAAYCICQGVQCQLASLLDIHFRVLHTTGKALHTCSQERSVDRASKSLSRIGSKD